MITYEALPITSCLAWGWMTYLANEYLTIQGYMEDNFNSSSSAQFTLVSE